ncbi:Verru_Chthon cassette protein A [Phragmitibacter flavus]|uniref:Verru_Chthon cassette protein A n=1 Tax=Phragmitibacter flavus TaxID=2576071 RepID=A0A5R8KK75_9BACT|nr:Verru_Chthon cassette protein A [Phragmitibacter flavus]TLD72641.1 Verru_Chthon cassette protein A [Phragmitibacter flavus]
MNPFSHHPSPRRQGIALVMVLVAIAVISMLVLAFLANARTEHRSASAFSDIASARTLAELPVNIAIGQIRRATEQNGLEKTWASQPGLIRVFGTEPDAQNSGPRSKTTALYKLYSDETMVVAPASASATADGMNINVVRNALDSDANDLADWQNVPGMYVDINEPAPVIQEGSNKVQTVFPISDPRGTFSRDNGRPVDGFQFDDNAVPGTESPSSVEDISARLPMPVKWLYVLADGQVLPPTGGNATTGLSFGGDGAAVPSEANPIVGRIAFWTDDESTKININTATEGTGWDVPRAYTATTVKFARRQAAQNEYSRYPGHPAQTSLSPVFQAFGEKLVAEPSMSDDELATVLERYHRISPRVPWGGSMGGTQPTAAAVVADKEDRLYTTLDEMLFNRDRDDQDPALTQQDIATSRFFLTTHSRAPELNLFNQPRMMLWPISADPVDRNAKDKLLSFVGTGGGKPWYFSRLQNFKTVDNAGSAQRIRGDLDLDNSTGASSALARNRELYEDHLIPLTGGNGGSSAHDIPGFGSNFAEKYTPLRRDQILTQIFDFMRWSVNSYSTGLAPKYTYTPPRAGDRRGESSAVPLIPGNDTKGFGRFPTITEAAIVFMATSKHPVTDATTQMQAFIALEPFIPVTGAPSAAPNVRYRISGLNTFTAAGRPMLFPAAATILCNTAGGYLDSAGSTAFNGFGQQFRMANRDSGDQKAREMTRGKERDGFPFCSSFLTVSNLTEFAFSGGTITIEVLTGFAASGSEELVQKIELNFPAATLKVPQMRGADAATYNTLAKRIDGSAGNFVNTLVRDGDVTRSVEVDVNGPSRGDLRLLCAMSDVPANWFTSHPRYPDTSVERLHFLRVDSQMVNGQFGPSDSATGPLGVDRGGRVSTVNTAGTLVNGIWYARDSIPAVVRGQNGALNRNNRPGDFDNGIGRMADGPYINKADENNINSNTSAVDGDLGYFSRHSFGTENGISFSPNRQIASAVAFGSLPSGIFGSQAANAHQPWQTLLFSPIPAARSTPADQEPDENDHEGFKGPRDHLWLDLFWMPVVEPYAISESFATGGKINMNYQLMPFRHIERSTGLHAVLKPTLLSAISPNSVGGTTPAGHTNVGGKNYKEGTSHQYELHYQVNRSETLKAFSRRFNSGDVFRSASEICEIFLVPQRIAGATYNTDASAPPTSYDDMVTWWNGSLNNVDAFEPTGDNSREAPYNQLYPRLTTKSNTFTVHFRVQTLKKARSTPQDRWLEDEDMVRSEHRGSATLERYLDPNDPELTVLASNPPDPTQSWDQYYRFRIINRKTFSP